MRWFWVCWHLNRSFLVFNFELGQFYSTLFLQRAPLSSYELGLGAMLVQGTNITCLRGLLRGRTQCRNRGISVTGPCESLRYVHVIFRKVRFNFQEVLGSPCLSWFATIWFCSCSVCLLAGPMPGSFPVLISLMKIKAVHFASIKNPVS